uniref:Uncharacterized protein n=1 Tax=Fagus sylvatica TaxID=28930 RepID=A0A2N9EBL1_FAGSY
MVACPIESHLESRSGLVLTASLAVEGNTALGSRWRSCGVGLVVVRLVLVDGLGLAVEGGVGLAVEGATAWISRWRGRGIRLVWRSCGVGLAVGRSDLVLTAWVSRWRGDGVGLAMEGVTAWTSRWRGRWRGSRDGAWWRG